VLIVGCIDLDNPDNAGIGPAIDALGPIVQRHAIEGVSRADIMALSAVVGTDIAQRSNSRIDFQLKWWGRVDCEKTGQACVGKDGNTVECSSKKGPHRAMPSIHMHTSELYGFFKDNFGFNQRETVAIMGAHTLGVVRQEVRFVSQPFLTFVMKAVTTHSNGTNMFSFSQDFGFDGSNGWVLDNDIMDNGYYDELIGGDSPNDPVEVLVNDAPAWRRAIENGIRIWNGFPSGVRIVMVR
jgi:hypothetical protein